MKKEIVKLEGMMFIGTTYHAVMWSRTGNAEIGKIVSQVDETHYLLESHDLNGVDRCFVVVSADDLRSMSLYTQYADWMTAIEKLKELALDRELSTVVLTKKGLKAAGKKPRK